MKKVHLFLVVIIVLAFVVSAVGQEPPKAILVDEFGGISCEDLIGRTDAFFAELAEHPSDVGYALIGSGGRNPVGFNKFVTANIFLRRFDRDRVKVVTRNDSPTPDGQFWRVPSGADPPKFSEIPETPADYSMPFIFGRDFDENVCPSFVPELYADLLKRHPGSKGNVVIYGPNGRQRKEYADTTLKLFENEFGLNRNTLRVFYVHRPKKFLTEVEFWFVPARKH